METCNRSHFFRAGVTRPGGNGFLRWSSAAPCAEEAGLLDLPQSMPEMYTEFLDARPEIPLRAAERQRAGQR